MILLFRAYSSSSYWKHGFSPVKGVTALLSSFGALWLLLEIVSFFSDGAKVALQQYWPCFLVSGVLVALWLNRPVTSVSCKLGGRDINLTICASDVFEVDGALIVGTNTTFDTDILSGVISERSIQGQFTKKYYDAVTHLDLDINNALRGVSSETLSEGVVGKRQSYKVGTVAKLRVKNRSAYLVAISSLNIQGVANAKFEDLKTALPALWEHIGSSGALEALVIPVLGTGYSRLTQTREEIIREIVNSFIAACSSKRFAESLTIAISPRDFYQHDVDIESLKKYLLHVCKYTEFGLGSRPGNGTAA